jgi:hypothetical protein
VADVDGDISVRDEDAEDAPASLKTRVITSIVVTAVLAVLILGYLHVALSPVAPSQAAPKGHYPGPCWACHMVSDSAKAAK